MAFQPRLVEITNLPGANTDPVVSRGARGAAALIVNVGGTTITSAGASRTLAGPDAAILTAGVGIGEPSVFVLLPGASIAFPADVGDVYARAANTTTTLSTLVGTVPV